MKSPYANQDFGVEFGGGREGVMLRYYKALIWNCFHNFEVMNLVDKNGIKKVVLLYNELEELWTSY